MEALGPALEAAGALAVSLADPGGEPILEPSPGSTPLWERLVVSALFAEGTDARGLQALVATALGGMPADLRTTFIEERDWVGEFRERLQPLRFGERLWICPVGTGCPDPRGIALQLEPGLAFGSGSHPTTRLCLEWLEGLDLRGKRVLDFGCGSGVLAIAALLLGAAHATALDTDPQALQASAANAARNGCSRRMSIVGSDGLPADARFDVIVANILAGTLVEAAPTLARHGRAGTHIAMSGILAGQSGRVRAGCAPWFDLEVAAGHDGWVLLAGQPAATR